MTPPGRVPRRLQRVLVSWKRHRLLLTVLLRPGPLPPYGLGAGVGIEFSVKALLHHKFGQRAVYDAVYFPPKHAVTSPVPGRMSPRPITIAAG